MGKIIEIGDTIRIEDGPPRKKTIATAEVLDNRITAGHYQEGALDAMGKKIVLGEEMTYLDWKGKHVFYIYQFDGKKWQPAGVEDTKEQARAVADVLAGGK